MCMLNYAQIDILTLMCKGPEDFINNTNLYITKILMLYFGMKLLPLLWSHLIGMPVFMTHAIITVSLLLMYHYSYNITQHYFYNVTDLHCTLRRQRGRKKTWQELDSFKGAYCLVIDASPRNFGIFECWSNFPLSLSIAILILQCRCKVSMCQYIWVWWGILYSIFKNQTWEPF